MAEYTVLDAVIIETAPTRATAAKMMNTIVSAIDVILHTGCLCNRRLAPLSG